MPQMDETALEAHEETRKGSIVARPQSHNFFKLRLVKKLNKKKTMKREEWNEF